MKISLVRKIYPRLKSDSKNIKWRSLTPEEIERAMKDKQVISNCYEDATRYALLASEKGRELLASRIKIQKNADRNPAYKIKLNVKGQEKTYRATKEDYSGEHLNLYLDYMFADNIKPRVFNYKNSRLSLGFNIAIHKMLKDFPFMKPLASRLYYSPNSRNRLCEHNKPSNAFRWFTGREPIAIGESGVNLSLRGKKDEVIGLLNDLGDKSPKDYSFVALTGLFRTKGINSWHTLPVTNVDNKAKEVTVLNKRDNKTTKFTFNEFVNSFKAIIGVKH